MNVFSDLVFDGYMLENNTSFSDEVVGSIAQKFLKAIFSAMETAPYVDYCGSVRIGIFDVDSSVKEDDPFFEVEFTSSPNNLIKDTDLDSKNPSDILHIAFDAIEADAFGVYISFGILEVLLRYRNENGEIDDGMVRAINREIADKIKEVIRCDEYCFNPLVKSGFSVV